MLKRISIILLGLSSFCFNAQAAQHVEADSDAQLTSRRCFAIWRARSSTGARAFEASFAKLDQADRVAFDQYLAWLLTDAIGATNHLDFPVIIKEEEKATLLAEFLNTWNPEKLVAAYFKQQNLLAAKGYRKAIDPKLVAFAQQFNMQPTENVAQTPGEPESVPNQVALERYIPATSDAHLELAESVPSTRSIAPVQPKSIAAPNFEVPQVFQNNEGQMRGILREEALTELIGSLLESGTSGNIEDRMLFLLIARIERLIDRGEISRIGDLSSFPEWPHFIRSRSPLSDEFRKAESAIRAYSYAAARLKYLEALRKIDVPDELSDKASKVDIEIAHVEDQLQAAREQLAPHLGIYIGVRTYLEGVVASRKCTVRCRVGALQTLSNLGLFDSISQATKESVSALNEAQTQAAAEITVGNKEAAEKALAAFSEDLKAHEYYDLNYIANIVKNDPELMRLRAKAKRWRTVKGALAKTFNSDAFRWLVSRVQGKISTKVIGWIPFVNSFMQETRDDDEIMSSVGPLLILVRGGFERNFRLRELQNMAANHPNTLVTALRDPLFASMITEAEMEAKDESFKRTYSLLLSLIEKAKKHPDASRPLAYPYEPSRFQQAKKILVGTAAMILTTVGLVNAAPRVKDAVQNGSWTYLLEVGQNPAALIDMLKPHISEILRENPEKAEEIRKALDTAQAQGT